MSDLELINQQIIDLQKILSFKDLAPTVRENYYNTLTFLLDSRALLIMNGNPEIPKEELN